MTTEPKFIPEDAVTITVDGTATLNVRMIDCVGYIVPSALGYIEDNAPRMVKTPWFDEEIPFNMAAELGTRKVINEHSTIGLVVTTDGSITEIPREEYAEAEERVVRELQEIHKPFVVLLNSVNPTSSAALQLSAELESKYGVPVMPVNCLELDEMGIRRILEKVLFEFPVREIGIELPKWLTGLPKTHPIRQAIVESIRAAAADAKKISQISAMASEIIACEYVDNARLTAVELGRGSGTIAVSVQPDLFYQILGETTGIPITDEASLMNTMTELAAIRKRYDKIKNAMDEVEATGYGIVMPSLEEMTLEEPEIIKQSGRYGIRLRAEAPSIHMLQGKHPTPRCRPSWARRSSQKNWSIICCGNSRRAPPKSGNPTSSAHPCTGWSMRGCTTSSTGCPPMPASSSRRRSSGSSTRDAAASSASSCKENSA